MTDLSFLAEPGGPLVRPWRGSATALVHALEGREDLGWLAGSHMRTREALLTEWAAAARFPPHFGGNWDALRDALSDLPRGATFLVLDADQLLQDAAPAEHETLWRVLKDVRADLMPKPFHIVLQAEPERFDALLEGLQALGLG